jgi:hypothetical protein
LADIVKVYTGDQLYEMYRNYVLNISSITDFNKGAFVRAVLESNSDIVSQIMMDFKEALYKAIPIALYKGLGFPLKSARSAIGFVRPYRIPSFTLNYTGLGTSALLNVSISDFVVTVTGAAGDNLNLDFATYPKTSDLVTFIDSQANWSASLYEDVNSNTIFLYSSPEIKGSIDFELNSGFDVMLQSDVALPILQGYSISVGEIIVATTEDSEIPAGASGIQIASSVSQTGFGGNIGAEAINTKEGKGFVNTQVPGVDFVINDSAFAGGRPIETETQRQIRFNETINGLNAGTLNGIIAAIKALDDVINAGMIPNFPFKGSNTIIVDDGSGIISPELEAEILKVLKGDPDDFENYPGKGVEGIGYILEPPTIVNVDIGITISRLSTVTADLNQMKLDARSAIEQYINTLSLGGDVILSEASRRAKNSNAAIYDAKITSPSDNIPIEGQEFAKTGAGYTGVVTVTAIIVDP